MIYSPQEYEILIDSMESGYGLITTMHQINEHRLELDLLDVGYTTVRRTTKRLDPVIRKIRRRKQGKRYPNSPWDKASLRWVTQLVVRLGKHNFDPAAQENEHIQLTNTPPYFDRFPPLSLHQIVFFDECHKKCEIRRTGLTAYSFPRDEDGLYIKDGDIADVDTKLHEKYPKEGRLSFGVSAVELQDGTVEGRHTRTFDYSAKNLVTITAEKYDKRGN
jgi:hypothetical protein